MKYPKLAEILKETGLTDHEAAVYLASLSLGPSTVLQIALMAELKRTTVYAVIERLKAKGLVAIEEKGFKRLFVAEHPERLESLMEAKRQILRSNISELSALYKLKGSGSVMKYYEGLEGVRSSHEALLADIEPNEEYLVVSNEEAWLALDQNYFTKFREKRAKLPIRTRMILQDSPMAREAKKFEKNYNYEVRLMPVERKLSVNLAVIPRRAVIHNLETPFTTIVIENQNVIRMYQEMFEVMWQSLKD
jgi:HTH-type transcriptional regulator, sugar sensing transcriptional regulator